MVLVVVNDCHWQRWDSLTVADRFGYQTICIICIIPVLVPGCMRNDTAVAEFVDRMWSDNSRVVSVSWPLAGLKVGDSTSGCVVTWLNSANYRTVRCLDLSSAWCHQTHRSSSPPSSSLFCNLHPHHASWSLRHQLFTSAAFSYMRRLNTMHQRSTRAQL